MWPDPIPLPLSAACLLRSRRRLDLQTKNWIIITIIIREQSDCLLRFFNLYSMANFRLQASTSADSCKINEFPTGRTSMPSVTIPIFNSKIEQKLIQRQQNTFVAWIVLDSPIHNFSNVFQRLWIISQTIITKCYRVRQVTLKWLFVYKTTTKMNTWNPW